MYFDNRLKRKVVRELLLQRTLHFFLFLANRTNGRAIGTVLRLSSVVVCDVMYYG